MKLIHRLSWIPPFLLLVAASHLTSANEKPGGSRPPQAKTLTNDKPSWFSINSLFDWNNNNGRESYNTSNFSSGLEFPKGSEIPVVFEAGIMWGGRHKGVLKVGGSGVRAGLQAGEITIYGGPSASALPRAADPTLAKYRIYRVRPDITPTTQLADVLSRLEEEAALINRYTPMTAATLLSDYQRDWLEWPAQAGLPAPYRDVDGNGAYDPHVDIPGEQGADQTLYYVANDLDTARVHQLTDSSPIGLEIHKTIWGYNRPGALGHTVFKRTMLINKSGAPVDSMFLIQWSDADLGATYDDLCGCDVGRDLAYMYNDSDVDPYYGSSVPPVGYVMCQGPMVPSPGDSAIFRGSVRRGFRNRQISAFVRIFHSDAASGDPPLGITGSALQWYRYMHGLINTTGEPYSDPTTGSQTRFCVNGDPLTRTGWVDGTFGSRPGDRRLGLSSGPFTLANGDTQEIIVATIVGDGSDRLSSVSVLKHYADQILWAQKDLFVFPDPPPSPVVSVGALDKEIILTWSDSVGSVPIETWKSGGQFFEGYNVYQYTSSAADQSSALRLATFDIVNHAGYIDDDVFDSRTGMFVKRPVQFGTDSGILRHLRITNDKINGTQLRNGTAYYFGMTAYTYDPRPGANPRQLESDSRVLTVLPQSPQGIRYAGSYGDTLKNVRHVGPTSGNVIATVVDPTAMPRDGAEYAFEFYGAGENRAWRLVRTVLGKIDTVAYDQRDFAATDTNALLVDGVIWKVTDGFQEFTRFLTVANGSGPLFPYQEGAFAFNSSSFPTADGRDPDGVNDRPDGTKQQSAGKLTATKGWGIHTGMNSPTMSLSYNSFRSRVTSRDSLWTLISPGDYEIRFTPAGGKALCATAIGSKANRIIDVPFELWNIGNSTPNDMSDDLRLFPYVLDVDNSGSFNLLTKSGTDSMDLGGGGPTHSISTGANDPFTDWFDWVLPQDQTPGDAGYRAILSAAQDSTANGRNPYLGGGTSAAVMRNMVLVGWNMGNVSTGPGSYSMTMPEPGTIFRFLTTKRFSSADVVTVNIPPATQGPDIAKADAERVGVFPNPYWQFRDPTTGVLDRHVTFTHLPRRTTIRIYTLAGWLVRSFAKDDESPFFQWDLTNGRGWIVTTGMYIVHIDMPEVGVVKILKLAIVDAQ